ncbi:MAG: EamA family transporter [Candidatus Saliniplasma sp.]
MDNKPILLVLVSAALFGVSTPLAKVLLDNIDPIVLAGYLYLGAFVGLAIFTMLRHLTRQEVKESPLEKKDIPWLSGAILAGGVLGPISLMFGLRYVSGFATSLLLNLEGVATALIAFMIFKENAGKKVWIALVFMTIAGILLSYNPQESSFIIIGPLLIVFAMICWGIDNNLTRHISEKNPVHISAIKGIVAGSISLSIAFILGKNIVLDLFTLYALTVGAFSYGISLVLFIKALKGMGSFRTGMFYSFGPFIGAIVSLILLREWIGWVMIPATVLMVIGVYMVITDKHLHTHEHSKLTHTHAHTHEDMHHLHEHDEEVSGTHIHPHDHENESHEHLHWPDSHHRHDH